MTMDDEQRKHLEKLLRTHRRRLRAMEEQAATFGTFVPAHIRIEIEDEQDEIARIEAALGITPSAPPPGQRAVERALLDRPPVDPATLDQLWKRALTAYFTRRWDQAEALLSAVAAADAGYKDVQAKLAETRRQRELEETYRQARDLRDEGLWEAVLGALDDLERREPGYPDPDRLRAWADSRRRYERLYDDALAAYDQGNQAAAIDALQALLVEFPGDADATALLNQARDEQRDAEEQAQRLEAEERQQGADQERRRREAAEQALRERLGPALDLVRAGDFAEALDLIEAALPQQAARDVAVLVAGLIEDPRAALEERLRAAWLTARLGDPRPGVATLEPAWCGPFPVGEYPLGDGNTRVRLGRFRIARYPATVWQFRQFYEAGGYDDERWWTPQGWQWRQARPVPTQPYRWNDPHWTADNQPVSGLSWYEARAFCAWLTQRGAELGWLRPDRQIRLPSEAEWEVAALWDPQAGVMRSWQPPEGKIWQNVQEAGIGRTSPVGLFPQGACACGALDMAGNAWEWCASRYDDYPRQAVRLIDDFSSDDWGPALRGGAYYLQNALSGTVARQVARPSSGGGFGFRVVLAPRRTP